jgi:hypothetical protein
VGEHFEQPMAALKIESKKYNELELLRVVIRVSVCASRKKQ